MVKTVIDQLGNVHYFEKTPQRIISLVPSQTELLYDLGLEETLLGITKFCVHPPHFKATKTIVGGTKNIKIDVIKALQPDIIICNKEENTKELVVELRKICTVWVTNVEDYYSNLQMIRDFGNVFNKRTEASNLIAKIEHKYSDFQLFIKEKSVKKVAYFIWAKPFMVAGKNTYINEMLKMNHFQNIYQEKESRYPEIELKKIRLEGDPDIVFLSSEPFPFTDEHAFEIGIFTHHSKTVFVDGEMFSWHGSRIVKAFDYFKQIHSKI